MSDPRRRWSWQMLKGARTIRVAGRKASWPQMLGNALRTRFEHLSLYIKGRQRLHHGPRTRIPDFAARRDWHFFNIIAHGLILGPATRQHDSPPPFQCHDLLDAAARVGQLEVRLGYTFKDKMKAMEALKLSNPDVPIVHDGRTYLCAKHQRIALLGDRVLELAVAQRWHGTGYSAGTGAKSQVNDR